MGSCGIYTRAVSREVICQSVKWDWKRYIKDYSIYVNMKHPWNSSLERPWRKDSLAHTWLKRDAKQVIFECDSHLWHVPSGFHLQTASYTELWCLIWSWPEVVVEQAVELPVLLLHFHDTYTASAHVWLQWSFRNTFIARRTCNCWNKTA